MALAAYWMFLREHCRANISELERRIAPILAIGLGALVGVGVMSMWILYSIGILG